MARRRDGATARQLVLSHDDLQERQGDDVADPPGHCGAYRGAPIKRGEIGRSSYVEAQGTPSGDTNFGV